jgi:hypothetical protein
MPPRPAQEAEHRTRRQIPDPEVRTPDGPEKKVSARAMSRLNVARDAIAATKRVMNFGAGNQMEALKDSRMNSYFRLRVMRDPSCWEMAPDVVPIARQNPEALFAAKADLAHGGNCGEHAWVALHYLREHAAGEHLAVSAKEGLDHAFVLIGDMKKDTDAEIAVSDPWPTRATACLWEDHFAHTADRSQIESIRALVADGKNQKAAIAAGLRLSDKGKKYVEKALTEGQTQKAIKDEKVGAEGGEMAGGLHVWTHPDAAADKFEYVSEETP